MLGPPPPKQKAGFQLVVSIYHEPKKSAILKKPPCGFCKRKHNSSLNGNFGDLKEKQGMLHATRACNLKPISLLRGEYIHQQIHTDVRLCQRSAAAESRARYIQDQCAAVGCRACCSEVAVDGLGQHKDAELTSSDTCAPPLPSPTP